MTFSLKSFSWMPRAAAVVICCAWVGGSTAQEDEKPKGATMTETARLFPMGKPWKNVVIPRHNEKDELTNVVHAEKLTRENDELMRLEGTTVVFLQPDGTMSLRIKTAEGFYNFVTERIKSRTKTFVEHPKFDMHGDSSEFDVKTQTGVLNGRVEMVIYEAETAALPLPAPPSAPSHAAEPSASAKEEAPSQ